MLAPDLVGATFTGHERIEIEVVEPVSEIVLNAAELDLTDARVRAGDRTFDASVELDGERERATLRLDTSLEPGPHVVELSFSGVLNDKLAGFYRSTYTDSAGNEQVIGTTQFEATDARRAFPCWDEPDRKAVFTVTLVVETGLTAISNSPVERVEAAGDGKQRVVFADTIPMSTYLVAFVVGPLELTEPVDVDGVPLRVACVPGKAHMAGFALEIGAHALRFFTDYFGLPYPGAKLDLIALPDFAFGAMENLGAVTFRETALLVEREVASRVELERVADVVTHEIAHMWFGDLVTMRWWNGIWLNEAFATFMEVLAVDDFRPMWERWVTFGISRAAALHTDGLSTTRPVEFPVVKPEDAEGMFDVLTYQKGASVVRMLEQYLGAETFREGIRRYMAAHAYGNTETTDLWDAIEEASGHPVRSTMDSWIFHGGYPMVTVEPASDGSGVVLTQRPFRYLPVSDGDEHGAGAVWGPDRGSEHSEHRWRVPVLVRAEVDGASEHRRLLLSEGREVVALDHPVDHVVVNAGGWGFYRTRYAAELRDRFTGDAVGRLAPIERFTLVSDSWAATLAGLDAVFDFVRLVERFGDDDDPNVWSTILGPLSLFERILPPTDRESLRAFVRRLAAPMFNRLGWERSEGESERTWTLRAVLVGALGGLGEDVAVRARASELHAAYLTERSSVDPNLVGAVVSIVAGAGGPAEYETFLERFRHAATPQEKVRYLFALAGFRGEDLLRRTLELSLSDEVRTQDAPYLVNAALGNLDGGVLAWTWVKDHWDVLTERFPDNSHARMVGSISLLVSPDVAADVHEFLAAHPVKSGQRTVAQTLERLDINVALAEREGGRLAAALAGER